MKKLIAIGVIIAILATTLMPVVAGARIPTEPPAPTFTETTFDIWGTGVDIHGGVVAYKGPPRKIQLLYFVHVYRIPYYQTYADIYGAVGMRINNVPIDQLRNTDVRNVWTEGTTLYGDTWTPIIHIYATEIMNDPYIPTPNGGDAILRVVSTWGNYQKAYQVAFPDNPNQLPYIADVTPPAKPLLDQIINAASLILMLRQLLMLIL